LGSGRLVELIFNSFPALIVVAEPGLEEWSSRGNPPLQSFTDLMDVVESSCVLSTETGERTKEADRMHVQYFSRSPIFGTAVSPDSSDANPISRVESRDP